MVIKIDDIFYPVVITKKRNKNTYIRVNDRLEISVTAPYYVSERNIEKLIKQNEDSVKKMLNRKKKEISKQKEFYYLGKKYDIIIVPILETVIIEGKYIYTKDLIVLEKWIEQRKKILYKERLDFQYKRFEEDIPYPKLKIRKMKTRWGVCNKKNQSITLNSELIREKVEALDYVIIHELSHFVHFDHSKAFWQTVSKYCIDYKKIRKELKE